MRKKVREFYGYCAWCHGWLTKRGYCRHCKRYPQFREGVPSEIEKEVKGVIEMKDMRLTKIIQIAKAPLLKTYGSRFTRAMRRVKIIERYQLSKNLSEKVFNLFGTIPPAFWDPNTKTISIDISSPIVVHSLKHELAHVFDDYYGLHHNVTLKPSFEISPETFRIRLDLYNPREWMANRLVEYAENRTDDWFPQERVEFKKIMRLLR